MKKILPKLLYTICLISILFILTVPRSGSLSQAPELNLNTDILVDCDMQVSRFDKKLTLTLANRGTSDYACNIWPYVIEVQKDGQWYQLKPAILHWSVNNLNETPSVYPPDTENSIIIDLRSYGLYLPKGTYRIILNCYTTEAKYNDSIVYHSTDYLSCPFETF